MIPLINKVDNFESVRDGVASILAAETVSQQVLATAAELDPDDFKFSVYVERVNPWDSLTAGDPIVNVWFDRSAFEKQGSNSTSRQKTTSRINCDIYVLAESIETVLGHDSGDELASKDAQRIARLVRNILMHDDYHRLSLACVWSRWVSEITMFNPPSADQAVENVVGCRVALDVEHNEEMVFADENLMEYVNIKYYFEPDGLLRAELDYGAETPPPVEE